MVFRFAGMIGSSKSLTWTVLKSIRRASSSARMSEDQVRNRFKRLAEENRQQRLEKQKKVKAKDLDFLPLKLVVLGNGSPGNTSSVIMTSANGAYLFNCGEGLQKLCSEYKMKIPKIQNLFFTSSKWENIGGLPGVCLTGQAMGLLGFNIHGPENILRLLDSTQNFLRVNYTTFKHYKDDYFEDQVLRVHRVKLQSSTERLTDTNEIYAYVCRAYDKPGQLRLDKCVDFGVPVGPLFSKLKAGEEITLENGKVVKPSDVMYPPNPGPVFIVLECPSEDYVESLLASKEIQRHQDVADSDKNYHANCVIHTTPDNVYKSEIYQRFLQRFPEKTHHVHLAESNTCETSPAAFRSLTRLHLIDQEIFPQLPMTNNDDVPPLTTVHLRTGAVIKTNPKAEISLEAYIKEAKESENFDQVRAQLIERLKSVRSHERREYPKLTFLGTGSSVPTKDRNVSGILVHSSESSCFLLDCGESTWTQIVRAHGVQKAYEILKRLKFIYISHIHADHHLGLFSIIKRRKLAGATGKLPIFGPSFIPSWFKSYSKDFERVECDFRDCSELLHESPLPDHEFSKVSVSRITTCEVDHCPEAYGVRVDIDNYSIVYSGDTRPCERLVQLGKNCDLLIHEATMEDDLAEDARNKGHSTISQAKEIGRKMNAKFTLLTHFSQRYAKLPMMDEAIFADGRLGLAFDLMSVAPNRLHVLPHIYPMLKCVFSDHYEAMQEKTQKFIERNRAEVMNS